MFQRPIFQHLLGRLGSCSEVYLEKAFEGTGFFPEERLPVARALGETSLMFLVHPTLSSDEMMTMCSVVCEVMRQAHTLAKNTAW